METKKSQSDREKIAGRLKEAREMAGLTQAQAADQLKLKRPAISEIEAGNRTVRAEEIIQFSKLYKVDTSWLLLQENDDATYMSEKFKFAARELGKLSQDDIDKVLQVLKILPK